MAFSTPQNNRKDESVRRANRVIQRRTLILMLIMGVAMFVVLFFKLFSLQIVRHEELQSLAVSQQTRSTVVTASRGTIYDASGNILAISSTAETVFLSPLELDAQLKDTEKPAKWTIKTAKIYSSNHQHVQLLKGLSTYADHRKVSLHLMKTPSI